MAYARGGGGREGGFGGQFPPPHTHTHTDDWKRNENLSFCNDPPLFMQRLPKLLLCFSVLPNLLTIILKDFHCDAIIPIVKLLWCVALDDCRKRRTYLLCNKPAFLRTEFAEIAVMFFLFCPTFRFNFEKLLLRCDATCNNTDIPTILMCFA